MFYKKKNIKKFDSWINKNVNLNIQHICVDRHNLILVYFILNSIRGTISNNVVEFMPSSLNFFFLRNKK